MSDNNLFNSGYVDITAGKHGGNKQSQEANKKIAPFKLNQREQLLGFMVQRAAEGKGTTRRDFADFIDKEGGQISGRFSELEVEGKIETTGYVEGGFAVYRPTGDARVPMLPGYTPEFKLSPAPAEKLTLEFMLANMAAEGFSVSLDYGEDNGLWECAWITSTRLYKGMGKTPTDAVNDCRANREKALEEAKL